MTVTAAPPYSGVKVWFTRELQRPELLPGLAREELADWMGDHPSLPDLQLIASELVTNALVHARPRWVRLRLDPEASFWRLTVIDPGTPGPGPRVLSPSPTEEGGRGLQVVSLLTHGQLGTHRSLIGDRVVWALLGR